MRAASSILRLQALKGVCLCLLPLLFLPRPGLAGPDFRPGTHPDPFRRDRRDGRGERGDEPRRKGEAALPGAQETDAQGLLRRMLQAERTLSLSGNQTTVVSRNGQSVTSEQRVLRNGSRALRLEYVRPASLAGEQIVDDGHLFRRYVPATNTLEVSPSRIQRLRGRVGQVMEQVKQGALSVQTVGQDSVAGHTCSVIEIAPARGARRRFWIDPTNGAQLRIDQYDNAGKRISTSYYTDVLYNPVFAKDAFQAPKMPATARVVTPQVGTPLSSVAQAQAQAGFTVLLPSFLPPGFRFQSAAISDYRMNKLVALRYVNGMNVLSLFETPRPPNARPDGEKHADRPRKGVVMGEKGNLRLVLIGNLSGEDMERVLDSVR